MKRSRESGVERERGERGVGGEGEFEGEVRKGCSPASA